jgi:hypothetical protein
VASAAQSPASAGTQVLVSKPLLQSHTICGQHICKRW